MFGKTSYIAFARRAIFILFAGWPFLFFGQNQKTLPFQHLTLGNGQDINFAYEILQDRRGFMWFATLDGVVRFDGFRFKHFPFDPEVRHPIKSKRVNGLLESRSGNIWMLSGKILLSYDPIRERFATVTNMGKDSIINYTYSKYNKVFVRDSSGNLWMRSNGGIFKINETSKPDSFYVKQYKNDLRECTTLSSDKVFSLFYDSRHRLWAGTFNGLNFYDEKRDKWVSLRKGCQALITHLCEAPDSKILIGTRNSGLWIFDPDMDTFIQYLPTGKNNYSIAGKFVRQIVTDRKGNIWLFAGSPKTRMMTLQSFDSKTGKFHSFFESFSPTGLGGSTIVHLFVDGAGFLWVATGAGLKRFDPYRGVFSDIEQRESKWNDLNMLYNFYESPDRILWMGTLSRGVLKYAPSTDKFRYYQQPKSKAKNLIDNLIRNLYEDSRGHLWSGTPLGTDRYVFDENDEPKKVAYYPFHAVFFLEDNSHKLWIGTHEGMKGFDMKTGVPLPASVFKNLGDLNNFGWQDREGWFWSATWGKGLRRYNPSTGEIMHFRYDPKNPNSVSSNRTTPVMLEDADGNIWFNGVNGLKKYDLKTGHFTNYLKGIETVYSIWGKDSMIWATTSGRGLYRFNPKTGETKCYSPKNGFPTLRPISIFKDNRGDLWMSSDVGVIYFQPETETARLFDESDGLSSVIFSYGSCQRKNGEFFFPLWEGGLVRFHPDSLRDDSIPPKPAIVDFRLLNKPVKVGAKNSPLSKAIWATERLILNHDQNTFTLGYSAFHYAAPAHNRFKYKMEGMDKDWIDTEGQHVVNFAGLSPDDYVFRLKAANHDGIWSKPTVLKITVLPPWWARWWAYFLYALIIGGLLYIYYRLQLQRRLAEEEAQRLREQFSKQGWFRLMQNDNLPYHDGFLKNLNHALEGNYTDEDFDIPQLCKTMNMSRAKLYRKVKDITGQPVGQVLRSYRLRRASSLLETTNLSVSQVAVEVGFKHLAHFSRSYQQEFGVNPSEVRK